MKLKEITIEITQCCPNNCIYCSSLSSLNKKTFLSFNEIKEIIDDALLFDVEMISLSGGEPFLHSDLIDIVRYIHKKGLRCNIYTSGIYHNGVSFDAIPESTLTAIQKLVDKLIFNIESASDSQYELIMGIKGGFELMKTSILRALQYGFIVESHTVLMKCNLDHLPKIMELGRSLGISKMSFLRLVIQGRALENKSLTYLSDEDIRTAKELIRKISDEYNSDIRFGIPLSECTKRINCMTGIMKLNIRYDGNVYPCEAFKNDSFSNISDLKPGNIKIERLKNIYENSPYLNEIRNHLLDFQQFDTCETCMSQYYIKNN